MYPLYPRERRRAFTWFVVILVVPFGLIMTVVGAFVLIGVTGGLGRLGLPGCGPPLGAALRCSRRWRQAPTA